MEGCDQEMVITKIEETQTYRRRRSWPAGQGKGRGRVPNTPPSRRENSYFLVSRDYAAEAYTLIIIRCSITIVQVRMSLFYDLDP